MPDWYPLMKAAQYLGVTPWELEKAPYYWQKRALFARALENKLENKGDEKK